MREYSNSTEALVIAGVILSRLSRAARQKASTIALALQELSEIIPPDGRPKFKEIIESIEQLDSPLRTIYQEINSGLNELFSVDRVIKKIADTQEGVLVEMPSMLQQDCLVRGNERLLQLAFTAVIENAIQATKRGPRPNDPVQITCEPRDGLIFGSITDAGQGIREDIRPHLFLRRYDGKGDDSFIAGRVMRLHEGDVTIRSSGLDGTTIDFWLPEARS